MDELYSCGPDLSEGEMTKIKSTVVSRSTCAEIAHEMGLVPMLVLGRGMPSLAKLPSSIAAAVFESIIGAIYLDGGIRAARRFILRTVRLHVEDALSNGHQRNYKSFAPAVIHNRKWAETPDYQLLDEKGPDHSKCFEIGVVRPRPAVPQRLGDFPRRRPSRKPPALALVELKLLSCPLKSLPAT